MSNVIGFLEKMGQDASLRHTTNGEMELALSSACIDPELRAAMLSSDQAGLEALLGVKANVCCMIFPAKEDEEKKDDEEPPAHDNDEVSLSHVAVRRMATSG